MKGPLPLIGTAGHVDHGKTSLVKALTGVDTDRLPEEKARGITTDLGFAVMDGSLAVVDVPGHERFVRTMLAGATGLDLVLFVIAADEGVMPQTREHLDICGLLGIRRGLVALTKIDRVEPDWLALALDDVRRALAGTFLEGAPILPVSSVTGAGLNELRAAIAAVAAEAAPRPAGGPLRLPLDRVFTMKGFGTVVTGTLASGRLRAGEEVLALPGGTRAVVRGLQVHGRAREEAFAGERVAANLQGAAREALGRGEVLARPGEMEGTTVLDVELMVLPIASRPLGSRARLLFHALTTQENAVLVPLEGRAIAPGGRALAQLHLGRPVPLLPGDRFILRGFDVLPGYGTTVGGGRVVRVHAPRRRRPDAEQAALLRQMAAASFEERVALEIGAAGAAGLDRAGLRGRLGDSAARIDEAVGKLLSRGGAVTFHRDSGAVVAAPVLRVLEQRALEALDAFHGREPLRPGLAREELRMALGRGGDGLDPRLFARLLADLGAAGAIETDGDLVRRARFSPSAAETEKDAAVERLRAAFREAALAPPWTADLPAAAGLPPAEARAAAEILLRRGEIVRVRSDLYFDRAALDGLRGRLREFLERRGEITAQEWKAMTGQTRKYAIPLAEHFDAEKVTLRVGEVRKLRR